MSAGRYRHRLIVERATEVDDGQGGRTKTWASVAAPWCEVEQVSARELYYLGLRGSAAFRVTTRAPAPFVRKDRISWGTRRLEVNGVSDRAGTTREIEALCTEVT